MLVATIESNTQPIQDQAGGKSHKNPKLLASKHLHPTAKQKNKKNNNEVCRVGHWLLPYNWDLGKIDCFLK